MLPANTNTSWKWRALKVWTGTDMSPELQQHSCSGRKLAIANTVTTRTLGCPLCRAVTLLAGTPQAEVSPALAHNRSHTLFILLTQHSPGRWSKVSPHMWSSHSSLPHGCPTRGGLFFPKKKEDESLPSESWLFRHRLGEGYRGGCVPHAHSKCSERLLQLRARRTSKPP